jgi:hypothetical protein
MLSVTSTAIAKAIAGQRLTILGQKYSIPVLASHPLDCKLYMDVVGVRDNSHSNAFYRKLSAMGLLVLYQSCRSVVQHMVASPTFGECTLWMSHYCRGQLKSGTGNNNCNIYVKYPVKQQTISILVHTSLRSTFSIPQLEISIRFHCAVIYRTCLSVPFIVLGCSNHRIPYFVEYNSTQ